MEETVIGIIYQILLKIENYGKNWYWAYLSNLKKPHHSTLAWNTEEQLFYYIT